MLQLLLDEHISPAIAAGVRKQHSGIVIHCLAEWEGGAYLGQDDAVCLKNAARQHLTLVTYDRRTIPPLLKIWSEQGQDHGGVIFVDEKTIAPSNVGALVRYLSSLISEAASLEWANRVCFLQR